MQNVYIKESLKVGWRQYMRRPWYLLGLGLGVAVLFGFSIGEAIVTALAYIVYGGYIGVLIKHYRGEHVVFDDLFMTDKRWVYFAFLGLIKGLLILVGLMLFIVPGIYLAVRWMFAEFFVLDQGMRPIAALRASSALTKGHRWKLFWFSFIVTVLFVLGLLCFIVGAVVVGIVSVIAMFKMYEDLKRDVAPVVS